MRGPTKDGRDDLSSTSRPSSDSHESIISLRAAANKIKIDHGVRAIMDCLEETVTTTIRHYVATQRAESANEQHKQAKTFFHKFPAIAEQNRNAKADAEEQLAGASTALERQMSLLTKSFKELFGPHEDAAVDQSMVVESTKRDLDETRNKLGEMKRQLDIQEASQKNQIGELKRQLANEAEALEKQSRRLEENNATEIRNLVKNETAGSSEILVKVQESHTKLNRQNAELEQRVAAMEKTIERQNADIEALQRTLKKKANEPTPLLSDSEIKSAINVTNMSVAKLHRQIVGKSEIKDEVPVFESLKTLSQRLLEIEQKPDSNAQLKVKRLHERMDEVYNYVQDKENIINDEFDKLQMKVEKTIDDFCASQQEQLKALDNLHQKVASHVQRTDATTFAVNDLERRFSNIRSDEIVKLMLDQMHMIYPVPARLQQATEDINKMAEALRIDNEARANALNVKVDSLVHNITQLQVKVGHLESTTRGLVRGDILAAVKDTAEEQGSRIDGLISNLAQVQGQVAKLIQDDVSGPAREQTTKIDGLIRDLSQVQARVEGLESNTDCQDLAAEFNERYGGQDDAIGVIQAELDILKYEMNQA